jgi:hypothetical protein
VASEEKARKAHKMLRLFGEPSVFLKYQTQSDVTFIPEATNRVVLSAVF